ncbi:leucine-rich repeat-containing protein 14 isoform X1 [Falco naumanni]|uniref:Leucine-rich repeat-containing protein 14 n=2 Tax=Falco TaxID=8952 RepID=A0A8C4UFE9_FALTI|nr:leucine-rich repeat-containing protein 14 isoform X1 [Falco naumanni]
MFCTPQPHLLSVCSLPAHSPSVPGAMHSLVFLCARRLLSHHPSARRALDLLPAELYPVLFQAAFLDGRTLALRDLVGMWPFPVLSFQQLLGHRSRYRDRHPLLGEKPSKLCVQAVILAVVAHLRQVLEEPCHGTSKRRCCLRVLDMTGLQDDDTDRGPERMSLWSGTVALAKACIEVSKHQSECLKRGSKRRKGPSGASAALQPIGVEVRADLFVNCTSYGILRDALQTGTASPLCLRCRDFHAEELSVASTVCLLESLEPTGVRRVDLRFNNLGLAGLCAILPHLARFTNLLSLKLPYSNIDVRRLVTGTDAGLQRLAMELGRLPCLKELNLGSSRLSGKLRQLLGDLQVPLESLELAFCYLLPSDLAFLSQSPHAPALKKLDLSGHNISENFLQPLQHLLEETSASLLHLDLMECQLTDARLEALLPALCRCSRLHCLGLFGNPLSTRGLQTLLGKTVVLPDLHLVVYPYPVDCYSQEPPQLPSASGWLFEDVVDEERFAAVSAKLRQMLVNSGRASAVWTTSLCRHSALDYFAL